MDWIEEKYKLGLNKLELGARPFLELSPDEVKDLTSFIKTASQEQLEKALLIAAHTRHEFAELSQALVERFNDELNERNEVFILEALKKHHLKRKQKAGERLSHDFLKLIESKLDQKNYQTLEWYARFIEECGGQAV